MLTELRHWKLARFVGIQMPRTFWTSEFLSLDLFLEGHDGVEERLWARWTSWDVHVHGDVPIDALEDVVALFERAA